MHVHRSAEDRFRSVVARSVSSFLTVLFLFALTGSAAAQDAAWTLGTGSSATYTAGPVGIGTTTPSSTSAAHVVNNNSTGDPTILLENKGNGAANAHLTTNRTTAGNAGIFRFKYYDSGANLVEAGTVAGAILDIASGTRAGGLVFSTQSTTATVATEKMRIDNSGNVGIGTASPTNKLHVMEATDALTFLVVENTNSSGTSAAAVLRAKADVAQVNFQAHGSGRTVSRFGVTLGGWNEFLSATGNGLVIGTNTGAGPLILGTASTARITVLSDGNTGIGTTTPTSKLDVGGNIHASGSITADGALYAKFQDVAEWVPATTNLEPGTVVVLNPASTNEVMASHTSYDTSVAGVVSAQPGLSLGVPAPGMEQIATTGRVKVRVDSRSAPIKVGDLLVTSDISGAAMRSEPMTLNGRKFHQPGTIIGKALEPHSGGEGEILVLLSLQ